MVKVLHVIWNAKFGGIEKLVYDLCLFQLTNDFTQPELLIVKNEGEFINRFSQAGLKVHSLDFKKGYDIDKTKFLKAKKLFKMFDIVHLHAFNPLVSAALIASKTSIAYTIHGGFGFGRKLGFSDFLLAKLKSIFLRHFVNLVTYNSRFTKTYAEKTLHTLGHKNAHLVYNGIPFKQNEHKLEETEYYSELKSLLSEKFVIGTSSRFAGFKRIDRLIEVFSQLDNLHEYILLLVGDGVLKESYKQQVKHLNIEEHVIFAGYQSNVKSFQQLMDVCVFPSQNEPFGLVAVETLALGKPTLVFEDGGGIVEIIQLNNSQDIVEDNTSLLQRLEFYKIKGNDPGEIVKRQRAANAFDLETMGLKFNELYKQLKSC